MRVVLSIFCTLWASRMDSSRFASLAMSSLALNFLVNRQYLHDVYNNKYHTTAKKSYSALNLIVSALDLHSMLGDRNLIIVDARPFSEYTNSHIPGAVNIDLLQFHWIDTSNEGIVQFNKQSRLLLSNIGISRKKFVVFYDNISGISAARGVWLLQYFSHER